MDHRFVKTAAALAALTLFQLAGCSKPAEPPPPPEPKPAPKAAFGAWGVDLSVRNESVKPGDDFFEYANGKWLASEKIPADRSRWGTFDQLADSADKQVREIIQGLPRNAAAGSLEQKIGDYYRSYLDTEAIEKAGLAPAQPGLEAIAKAADHKEIARLMGDPALMLTSPIGMGFDMDDKNPDRYMIVVVQSGLSLPDREYYLKTDAESAKLREQFRAHVERMLGLAGDKDAARESRDILALETKIAQRHWPVDKSRERELTYNLRTREQLEKLGGYPWSEMLSAAGFDAQKEFIVKQLSAVEALGKLFAQVPVETWKSYLRYHYLVGSADVLPKAFDHEAFDFYDHVLNGQPEQRERWKLAVAATGGALGEAVGQLYVKQYFPADSKAKMKDLVENLRKAYSQRIQGLSWMTEETKKVALEKLATFRPKIGYPDKWRDYSAFEVRANDAFGNLQRGRLFDYKRQLGRMDQPTDRDEWGMTPQTVNAYYNPTFNEIVFPAAILQPPFFDPNADPAVNYGAIGGVIGHEMGHGFDDQGAKSDAKGVLRTWWKPADEKSFKGLVDRLVKQYNAYEPLQGLKINGKLTLGENIGDLGGLTVAYEAYKISLGGSTSGAPVLDGTTGDQRLFLSWAQCWRTLMRDEALRNQVMSNPHSPPKYRVNGVVRNMDAWYEAFNVQPGEKLYLKPEERVRIW